MPAVVRVNYACVLDMALLKLKYTLTRQNACVLKVAVRGTGACGVAC